MAKIIARSASDRTDDWPFWMIWDGVKNVTAETLDAMSIPRNPGAVFLSRHSAENVAVLFNYSIQGRG